MADTYVNASPKVTHAAATAANALALRELTCANNFDPSVTGLAVLSAAGVAVPGIGAKVTTLDGSKCWQKWGTGDTQWSPLHAIFGTFGENVATWDTTALIANLACNTLGGFKIVFDPIVMTSGATQVVVARINGARLIDNAVGNAYLTSIPWATPAPVCNKKARLAETGNDGTWLNLTITCEHARSGSSPWVIESEAIYRYSATYPAIRTRATLWSLEAPPLAEITSFGLAVTNDSYSPEGTMGAASRATITRI